MTALLATTLRHLRALVAFDTRNPPRAIGTGGIFDYLRANLPGFDCTLTDHGAGAVSLFAVRGNPKILFNVHLDTVPGSPHWSANPFELRVTDDRAIGLGACDIKGAAAALLVAANASDGDAAFLFTTDEEANDARCIAAFLDAFPAPAQRGKVPKAEGGAFSTDSYADCTGALSAPAQRGKVPKAEGGASSTASEVVHLGAFPASAQRGKVPKAEGGTFLTPCDIDTSGALPAPAQRGKVPKAEGDHPSIPFEAVIVAEPTHGEAVLAHRGISSVLMRFAGRAGHASAAQQDGDSAVHQALRWGSAALDHAAAQSHQRFGGLTGLRFNIGRVEGGIKANMIAPTTELRFGFRPLPSMDIDELLATFHGFAEVEPAEFTETFRGPALPAGNIAQAEARRLAARELADALELPVGNAVDFWTEASLFSQAGYTAIVYGPGDIAQAHSADEWVALDQLERVASTYRRLLEQSR